VIALVTIPLIGFMILSYAGEALFPALTPDPDNGDPGRPLALILTAPSIKSFAAVSTSLDPWSYYGIGVVRVVLSDPFYYLLGFWFGHSAITWMERRTRTWGDMIRQLERAFGRYGYLILFALPYGFLPLLAGASRLRLPLVILVRAAGIGLRLFLIRQLGFEFQGGLNNILGWIGEYRVPLLIVSASFVVLSLALEFKKKGETNVQSLAHLDEEIEAVEQESREPEG
jgi:membrane protein DedA with SNARE-associated domain